MIRTLARHGYKAVHSHQRVPVPGDDREGLVSYTMAVRPKLPLPRSFVFAFSQRGFRSPEMLKEALENSQRSSHIHGLSYWTRMGSSSNNVIPGKKVF